ncbi:MAG: hypothetical protein ACREOJ_14790 [Gemmatimonadaceae bacterium]
MKEDERTGLERVGAVRPVRGDAGAPGGKHNRTAAIEERRQRLPRKRPLDVVDKHEARRLVRADGICAGENGY